MTYSLSSIQIRHFRLTLPPKEFQRPSFGRQLESICGAIMQAKSMAYVAPFTFTELTPSNVTDEDLGGRDPNW